MNIFVGWSKKRGEDFAKALICWIKALHIYVTPKYSGDIGAGSEWRRELYEQLRESYCSVFCIPPEGLDSPWILFEAGVSYCATRDLSGDKDKPHVIPLLLDVDSSARLPDPLSALQAIRLDTGDPEAFKDGMRKLAFTLNDICAELSAVNDAQNVCDGIDLGRLFEESFPSLLESLHIAPKAETGQLDFVSRKEHEETLKKLAAMESLLKDYVPANAGNPPPRPETSPPRPEIHFVGEVHSAFIPLPPESLYRKQERFLDCVVNLTKQWGSSPNVGWLCKLSAEYLEKVGGGGRADTAQLLKQYQDVIEEAMGEQSPAQYPSLIGDLKATAAVLQEIADEEYSETQREEEEAIARMERQLAQMKRNFENREKSPRAVAND